MTFAVGIRVEGGLVALADTQVVRGHQTSNKGKLSVIEHSGSRAFVMTSGLRSIRDKTVLRLEDELAALSEPCERMHQLVTAYGDQLKQVRDEDNASLMAGGLKFDSHAIIGGQLPGDAAPELFLVYPEGNWVVATTDSPSFIVGRSAYGKPILDRLLRFDTPIRQAVALAYLAFDATRTSTVDVGYPFDLLVLDSRRGALLPQRFVAIDLQDAEAYWQERLQGALTDFPDSWADAVWSEESRLQ
ncbi:MAG: proteasome-type protease [Acidimicrobiales bacterium]